MDSSKYCKSHNSIIIKFKISNNLWLKLKFFKTIIKDLDKEAYREIIVEATYIMLKYLKKVLKTQIKTALHHIGLDHKTKKLKLQEVERLEITK